MEFIIFLSEKRSGEVKGRLAYNEQPTRHWISRNNKTSPTVLKGIIFLTTGIDAKEIRDLVYMEIPNIFYKRMSLCIQVERAL